MNLLNIICYILTIVEHLKLLYIYLYLIHLIHIIFFYFSHDCLYFYSTCNMILIESYFSIFVDIIMIYSFSFSLVKIEHILTQNQSFLESLWLNHALVTILKVSLSKLINLVHLYLICLLIKRELFFFILYSSMCASFISFFTALIFDSILVKMCVFHLFLFSFVSDLLQISLSLLWELHLIS